MNKPRSEWQMLGAQSRIQARKPEEFLAQHVTPLLFKNTRPGTGGHQAFGNEEAFWKQAGELPFGSILLDGFRLIDWFPRAPGVYWSERGITARHYTFGSRTTDDPVLGRIYSPQSKMGLIEDGGIGTIRLRPRRIDGTDCWLASAVSGSECAGGVPLAIPDSLVSPASLRWGDTARVYGQVRFLEDVPELEHIAASVHHAHSVLVFVEKIEVLRGKAAKAPVPLILTPVVLFASESAEPERSHQFRRTAQYTFVSVAAGDDHELDEAGEWVEMYAAKFGGRVITNFDERRRVLANAPLSYQRLLKGNYERAYIENVYLHGTQLANRIDRIERVEEHMTVNVTLGDGTVVHGDVVVANTIKKSFNRAANASGDGKLKVALESLASQIGKLIKDLDPETAKQAADDLDTFTKEATRAKPRRSFWEVSLNGLTDAAKKIGALGEPILKTAAALATLLSAVS